MSGLEKLARLLLSGAAAGADEDVDELDDEALSAERGVAGSDELRSATSGANSADEGRWLPLCRLGPRRKNSRASRARPLCRGDTRSAGSGSLCGDGLLASSSMKLMSDMGRPPGWLRELCRLCRLWTLRWSSMSSSVLLKALTTRSWTEGHPGRGEEEEERGEAQKKKEIKTRSRRQRYTHAVLCFFLCARLQGLLRTLCASQHAMAANASHTRARAHTWIPHSAGLCSQPWLCEQSLHSLQSVFFP